MAGNKVTLQFNFSDNTNKEVSFTIPDPKVNMQRDIYDREAGKVAILLRD